MMKDQLAQAFDLLVEFGFTNTGGELSGNPGKQGQEGIRPSGAQVADEPNTIPDGLGK